MKFDKSKVYTILNKDEVKPGMIGYVTNDLPSLRSLVENDRNHCLKTLNRIIPASDKNIYCFAVEDGK